MIIKDYTYQMHSFDSCNDNTLLYIEAFNKEDDEFIKYYLKNKKEILENTDNENLEKLIEHLNIKKDSIINFKMLPFLADIFISTYIALKNYKNASYYLRTFKSCLDKEEKNKKVSHYNLLLFKEIYYNYLKILINQNNEAHKEQGRISPLFEYFNFDKKNEKHIRELQIRMIMRILIISRAAAIRHIKKG